MIVDTTRITFTFALRTTTFVKMVRCSEFQVSTPLIDALASVVEISTFTLLESSLS